MEKVVTCILVSLIAISSVNLPEAFGQEDEIFVEERKISRNKAVALSFLFPGVGHFLSNHNLKGGIFFLSEVVSLVVAVDANERYRTKVSEYDGAKDDYLSMEGGSYQGRTTYEEAEGKWQDLLEMNRDLDRLHNVRRTFAFISAGIYMANIIDILFFSDDDQSRVGGLYRKGLDIQVRPVGNCPGIVISRSL